MNIKEQLMKELNENFNKLKSELDFEVSLEELDKYFFIKDAILEKSFVSDSFSNQLRSRIMDVMVGWDNYLHSLIMPNPQNLFNINEAKALDENDKKEVMRMMSRVAHFVSRNGLVRISRDKEAEGKLIDDSLKFWRDRYEPFFYKVMEKIEDHWKDLEKGTSDKSEASPEEGKDKI